MTLALCMNVGNKAINFISMQLFDFSDDDIAKMLAANVLTEVPYNEQ